MALDFRPTLDFQPEDSSLNFQEIPTLEPQLITPEGQATPFDEEHDFLFYKTGKTKSEREALNKPLREAMQVPAVSPETIGRGLQAVSEIGAISPEDLQQGPVEQGINESLAQTISGMTSGEGASSLPLYIFPPTSAGLTAENVEQLPSQVQEVAEKIKQGDVKGAASTGTSALLNALMTAGVVHGGAKFMGGERVGIPSRAGSPELPLPTKSLGPGTIADDVSRALERRFTLQEPPPEAPPQLAPAPPIEGTLANLPSEPPVFNPELGPTFRPDFEMPLRTETANLRAQRILDNRRELLARQKDLKQRFINGEPGVETELQAVEAELKDPVKNPVVHAPPGYTAKETTPAPSAEPAPVPVAEAPPPEPYTPEAAAARAAQPQPATEPVGGNVAGFEKVYGPGEIPAGETISPEGAWDAASARAQGGKAQPYGFVDRARTGAITPEEMGDLIYEHHRLVERAAGLEGMPEYAGASQAAKDFASNVLKPAETAWHQKGMVMQIERPVNLNTFTGMDQLMQTELNRGIKPSEAPKFTRMAEDVKNGESEVAKAVERSDARVRTKYAKVRDIPIEEAVARVKQMLKDCM